MTETRDYNGPAEWSAPSVQERYLAYARKTGQKELFDLRPREHREGATRWLFPVVERVAEGIKAGDPACVELGVEFVEWSGKQPFGRILHANMARALRRAILSPHQVDRLRRRILAMLLEGQVPHEYHEYAKLLRHIGLGPEWPQVASAVDRGNPYVRRYVDYFEKHAS